MLSASLGRGILPLSLEEIHKAFVLQEWLGTTTCECRDEDQLEAFMAEHGIEDEGSDASGKEPQTGELESEPEEEGDLEGDEALARRLFIDEQLRHQRRLLAIAGKLWLSMAHYQNYLALALSVR